MKKDGSKAKIVIGAMLLMLIMTVILIGFEAVRSRNDHGIDIEPEDIHLIQLEEPAEGAPTATIETTLGSFSFVLYPEQSPNAVKNFTELAESGYYDGTYIFDSESGAFSAGGCPRRSGELPEGHDEAREHILRELSPDLWPFRGAICVLNTGTERTFKEKVLGGGKYYNGSRLAFINTIEFTDEYKEQLLSDLEDAYDSYMEKRSKAAAMQQPVQTPAETSSGEAPGSTFGSPGGAVPSQDFIEIPLG